MGANLHQQLEKWKRLEVGKHHAVSRSLLYHRQLVDIELSRRNNRTGLLRLANEGDGAAQGAREPMAGQSSLTSLVYSTNT